MSHLVVIAMKDGTMELLTAQSPRVGLAKVPQFLNLRRLTPPEFYKAGGDCIYFGNENDGLRIIFPARHQIARHLRLIKRKLRRKERMEVRQVIRNREPLMRFAHRDEGRRQHHVRLKAAA